MPASRFAKASTENYMTKFLGPIIRWARPPYVSMSACGNESCGREVFVPQSYALGQEAQVDWFEAAARLEQLDMTAWARPVLLRAAEERVKAKQKQAAS